MHFYVYILKEDPSPTHGEAVVYLYDRTCGTRRGAEDRVKELKGRGQDAVWLQDHLINGAYH